MEKIDLLDLATDLEGQEKKDSIVTKKRRAYSPEVRKLYYSLLADGIPASKVASIIQTVI